MMDSPAFAAWKARRAERAATAPTNDDRFYEAWTSAASGEQAQKNAGVAQHLEPGGPDPAANVPDDVIYQGYTDMLDGTAGRRRAQQTVRRERLERQEEHERHSREMGYPLPTLFED